MKLTAWMKTSLIQWIFANMIFLILFVGIFLLNLYPSIQEIEVKKEDFNSLYRDFQDFQEKGIPYPEYSDTLRMGNADSYQKTLLRSVGPSFYNENFINEKGWNYSYFLDTLEQEIQDKKNAESYVSRDNILSKILPYYSENTSFDNNHLTDFHFINSIENILYAFNINFIWEIGVGNIQNIEKPSTDKSDKQVQNVWLWENIFSIPLSLTITGRKIDIVNFLHYFENVWWVNVVGEKLILHSDSFLRWITDLWGEQNIYLGHFADIQLLSMEQYPDASSTPRSKTLIPLLKTEQAKQRMNIDIMLNFYVAGVPGYQMEQTLLDYFENFTRVNSSIAKATKKYSSKVHTYNTGEALRAISNLQSLEKILIEMQEETQDLRKAFSKKDNFEVVFQTWITFQNKLTKIEEEYKQIIGLLE